ncbi:hypothetical protein Tco_0719470 [Tanacetum coccineum]
MVTQRVKRTVGEIKQEYEPTTGEEKLDRRNEMKDRGNLFGDLRQSYYTKGHELKTVEKLPSEWKTHDCSGGKRGNKDHQFGMTCTTLEEYIDMNFSGSSSYSKIHKIAAHTQCNSTSRDNLSGAMICAFLASQPNSPQLAREDLEQIDPNDLEKMDLQWEMSKLIIRARRFI